MGAQLAAFNTSLDTKLDALKTSLDTKLDTKLDAINTRLDNMVTNMVTVQHLAVLDFNSRVRVQNARVQVPEGCISWLNTLPGGALPQQNNQDRGPVSQLALHNMPAQECQALLTMYGLPVPGNLKEKRQELCLHLGALQPV
jgi:hypothetical protein